MPNDQHDPNPPLSEREMERINLEFKREHYGYLKRLNLRSPHTVQSEELANWVSFQFHRRYSENSAFRAKVLANGGIRALRTNKNLKGLFWTWINNGVADQMRLHYKFAPRDISLSQIDWLRLASYRQDGMLFPLVRVHMSRAERRILESLASEKVRKVGVVPTEEGVGVWARDSENHPLTLRPTDKGFGGGVQDLELLIERGYLERLPCTDANTRWRYEDNKPVTLRLTATGRGYIDSRQSGALWVNITGDSDEGGCDPADDAAGPDELFDENLLKRRSDGVRIEDVLAYVLDRLDTGMTKTHARIYMLRKFGDPAEKGPWTLERVAKDVGMSKSEVQRREKKWDELFENPEILAALEKSMRAGETPAPADA
jgi:hypothetical protein